MTVPVEFFIWRHDHEEESVLVSFVYGKGYDGVGDFEVVEDSVERGYAELVELGAQCFEVGKRYE